jgi:hypothetical protein
VCPGGGIIRSRTPQIDHLIDPRLSLIPHPSPTSLRTLHRITPSRPVQEQPNSGRCGHVTPTPLLGGYGVRPLHPTRITFPPLGGSITYTRDRSSSTSPTISISLLPSPTFLPPRSSITLRFTFAFALSFAFAPIAPVRPTRHGSFASSSAQIAYLVCARLARTYRQSRSRSVGRTGD